MGTFQLVLKQMRQRALGTWLTLLSVLLGVALAISILLLRDAGQALFGQTEYGYDAIIGIGKGSPTQLVMNTVYHIDKSPGNIPYWVYEQINTQRRPPRGSKEFDFHRHVKLAVPIAVGDVYQGRPIVGTLPKMFVSLSPLADQADGLMQKQAEISGQASDHARSPASLPADLAHRQEAIAAGVDQLRQQVVESDRGGMPLVVPPKDGTPSKWLYGTPASQSCADAAKELRDAAQAITSNNVAQAIAHQKTGYDLLHDVLDAVNAATGPLQYRPDKTFELAQGRVFNPWKFEAVIGSEVAAHAGLKMGDKFQATHGVTIAGQPPDVHPEKWQVVGILKPTHTAADRCLYIPLLTFYTIAEHETGLEAHSKAREQQDTHTAEVEKPKFAVVYGDELLPDLPHTQDFIRLDVPPREWEVSAILVRSRGDVLGQDLIYYISNGGIPDVEAVNPAGVMRQFFETFLGPSAMVLLLISLL
ncbi:MAG TPA: hypothetical protein VN541_15920, partial [Tepidisphaeraceae bacterium]|nr:hypothetical protein [Tepidisphaeraceae bacterium]